MHLFLVVLHVFLDHRKELSLILLLMQIEVLDKIVDTRLGLARNVEIWLDLDRYLLDWLDRAIGSLLSQRFDFDRI